MTSGTQTESISGSTARWVLTASIMASSMAFIDGTALSVAMPSLQADLGASGAQLLWIVNGFAVPLAALLLLGGALGDIYGRKKMLMAGIAGFAAASTVCGLAPDVESLIAGRVAQGVAGAVMIPGSLAILAAGFEPGQRGRAIGTWSAFSVLASAAGPVLGGVLAGAGLWRWVFFINLPLAGFALALLYFKTPSDKPPERRARLDWTGALLAAAGLAALNHGLIQWPEQGLGSPGVWGALLASIVLFAGFGMAQKSAQQPLIPLAIFQSRDLRAASLVTVLFYLAFHGMLFFLPLNLIQAQGYDAALAGLTQLPLMLMLVLLSRPAGRLLDRSGPRLLLTVGPLVAGVGFLLLALPGVTSGPAEFWIKYLPGLLLAGCGLGITAAPLSTTVMDSVPSTKLGLASGINSSLSRLTAVLAIMIMGAVMLSTFDFYFTASLDRLEIPAPVAGQIKQQSAMLAGARAPAGMDEAGMRQVERVIKEAFVDAFRVLAVLAAVCCWCAALVAARSFHPRHQTKPDASNP